MHFMQSADFEYDERLVLFELYNQLAENDCYACQPIGPIGPIWSGPGEVEIEFKRIAGRKWRRGTNDVDSSSTIKHPLRTLWAYARSQSTDRLTLCFDRRMNRRSRWNKI